MKKRLWSLLLGMMMAAALTGCSLPHLTLNPQDLYSLPTLPAKYTELNAQLSAIQDSGAEYAAPTSGANIQPVQVVDLNGDGREEAVAFFRNSAEEKPLSIYIFTNTDDSYQLAWQITGSGTGIYSIAYTDMDGDGWMELLVGWKATAELQVLEVYALHPNSAEVLVQSEYVKYVTADLDQDQRQELVVLHADEEGDGVADYYGWQSGGGLTNLSTARISVTMAELNQQGRVTQGKLEGDMPALFVTGVTDIPRAVTDILAVRNGELSNIVLSEITGVSGEIAPYCSLYPTDINGDGLTEVPKPVQILSTEDETRSYQRVDWYSYDSNGASTQVLQTYHNIEDGWYLRLPESWIDKIWVSRVTATDENTVTFYRLDRGGLEDEPFLRITAITGTDQEKRAMRGSRFVLGRQSETIYTAELLEANADWKSAMTENEVREAFSLIAAEWTAGDY